jgi:hypothetical protein
MEHMVNYFKKYRMWPFVGCKSLKGFLNMRGYAHCLSAREFADERGRTPYDYVKEATRSDEAVAPLLEQVDEVVFSQS